MDKLQQVVTLTSLWLVNLKHVISFSNSDWTRVDILTFLSNTLNSTNCGSVKDTQCVEINPPFCMYVVMEENTLNGNSFTGIQNCPCKIVLIDLKLVHIYLGISTETLCQLKSKSFILERSLDRYHRAVVPQHGNWRSIRIHNTHGTITSRNSVLWN